MSEYDHLWQALNGKEVFPDRLMSQAIYNSRTKWNEKKIQDIVDYEIDVLCGYIHRNILNAIEGALAIDRNIVQLSVKYIWTYDVFYLKLGTNESMDFIGVKFRNLDILHDWCLRQQLYHSQVIRNHWLLDPHIYFGVFINNCIHLRHNILWERYYREFPDN